MAKVYSDFQNKAVRLVKDKSLATNAISAMPEEVNDAIDDARSEYSLNFPQQKVQEYTGTGNREYDLPELWQDVFSNGTMEVVYPYDVNAIEPQPLDASMCQVVDTPDGQKLRFFGTVNTNFLPAEGEKFLVKYGIQHQLGSSYNTIPEAHFNPFCKLVGSNLALTIATRTGQGGTGSGRGDIMNYPDKGNPLVTISKMLREQHINELLGSEESDDAAFILGEFEESPLHRNPRPSFPTDNSGRQYVDY